MASCYNSHNYGIGGGFSDSSEVCSLSSPPPARPPPLFSLSFSIPLCICLSISFSFSLARAPSLEHATKNAWTRRLATHTYLNGGLVCTGLVYTAPAHIDQCARYHVPR